MATKQSSGKALSLQKLAFLHLALYLDDYPPDALSLLPLRLRQELLLQLAPADILQLEQTSMCEGIEMDEIWKNLCYKFILKRYIDRVHCSYGGSSLATYVSTLVRYGRNLAVRSDSTMDWRECFLLVLCNLVLYAARSSEEASKEERELHSGVYFLLLQYLFCNMLWSPKHRPREGGSCLFVFGQVLQPPRYAVYTCTTDVDSSSLADLLVFLTDVCRVYPKTLLLDCSLFYVSCSSDLPVDRALQAFLGQVESLYLVSQSVTMPARSHESLAHLLSILLHTTTPKLRSLFISLEDNRTARTSFMKPSEHKANSLLKNILLTIRPFFTDILDESEGFNLPCANGCATIPYLKLQSLRVAHKGQYVSESSSCAKYFFEMVHSQRELKVLEIAGWWTWSDKTMNVSTVCSRFFSSQLSVVELRQLDLPAFVVQSLVEAFLQSTPTHRQDITFYSVWMYGNCHSKKTPTTNHDSMHHTGSTGDKYKYLTLQSMYIPNSFIQWLTTLECVHLNTLVLCDVQYDRDMYPGGIIGALGVHHNCRVGTVDLSTHTQYCPSEGLDTLLQNPALRNLRLTGPKHKLFDNLRAGLQHQARVGNLRTLEIRQTSFTEMDTSEFEELAAAVFGLPQLSDMTLEIKDCQLLPEQVAALGNAWEKRTHGRQKLHRFSLVVELIRNFPKCEEPAFLYEIGKNVELKIKASSKH